MLRTVIAGMPRRARVSILRDQIGSKIGRGKSHRAMADVSSGGVREIRAGKKRLRSDARIVRGPILRRSRRVRRYQLAETKVGLGSDAKDARALEATNQGGDDVSW